MPKKVLCVVMIFVLFMSFTISTAAYNAEINGEVIVWNPGIKGESLQSLLWPMLRILEQRVMV